MSGLLKVHKGVRGLRPDRRVNILSVDWDYFVKASFEQRMRLFPDGGSENGMSEIIQSVVWSTHYAENEELKDLKVKAREFKLVRECFKKFCDEMRGPSMVTDSHRFAYDFIHENVCQNAEIRLVNIDFHHDVYQHKCVGEDEVNCGNWLLHIMEEYSNPRSEFLWVCQEDSGKGDLENVSDDDDFSDIVDRLTVTSNIKDAALDTTSWDMIFLCRSGVWSPIHLDRKFILLAKELVWGAECKYEEKVFQSRMNKEAKDLIRQYSEMMSKMKRR